jgi:hypothetical protein
LNKKIINNSSKCFFIVVKGNRINRCNGDGKMLCFLLLYADLSGPLAFERQTAWRQTNPEGVALAPTKAQARTYLDILASHNESMLSGDAGELEAINKIMPQDLKVTKHSRLAEGWFFVCNNLQVFFSCANTMWWDISETLGKGVETLIRCFQQRESLRPFVSRPEIEKDHKEVSSARARSDTDQFSQIPESELSGNNSSSSWKGRIQTPPKVEIPQTRSIPQNLNSIEEGTLETMERELEEARQTLHRAEEASTKKKETYVTTAIAMREKQKHRLFTAEIDQRAACAKQEAVNASELGLTLQRDLLNIQHNLLHQSNKQYVDIVVKECEAWNHNYREYHDTMRALAHQRDQKIADDLHHQRLQELEGYRQDIDDTCGTIADMQTEKEEREKNFGFTLGIEHLIKTELEGRLAVVSEQSAFFHDLMRRERTSHQELERQERAVIEAKNKKLLQQAADLQANSETLHAQLQQTKKKATEEMRHAERKSQEKSRRVVKETREKDQHIRALAVTMQEQAGALLATEENLKESKIRIQEEQRKVEALQEEKRRITEMLKDAAPSDWKEKYAAAEQQIQATKEAIKKEEENVKKLTQHLLKRAVVLAALRVDLGKAKEEKTNLEAKLSKAEEKLEGKEREARTISNASKLMSSLLWYVAPSFEMWNKPEASAPHRAVYDLAQKLEKGEGDQISDAYLARHQDVLLQVSTQGVQAAATASPAHTDDSFLHNLNKGDPFVPVTITTGSGKTSDILKPPSAPVSQGSQDVDMCEA